MRPDARERRTIAIGAWVVVIAMAITYLVLPFLRRIGDRQAEIGARREQVGRLTTAVARRADIDSLVAERRQQLAAAGAGIVRARSAALVAADVQRVLQNYARVSQVSVSRLDVEDAGDTLTARRATPMMTATLSGMGDVYGVAQLLANLQGSPLDVSALSVSSTSGVRGSLLQLSVTVRAPYQIEEP